MAIDYRALANAAAQTDDQTETKASFEFSVPPAGPTVGRLVEYIECGDQPRKAFGGKEKKPAPYVLLKFDLLSKGNPAAGKPGNIREHEGVTYCDTITIRINKLLDGKAGYKKLFNTMVRGRDNIKHMAQMLGECFRLNVIHSKSKDGSKTYANLRDENGTWFINAPVVEDALSGTVTDISGAIPAAISPIRIFIWDHPTQETWDSLYIDGTRTVKKQDGTEEQVSKNWIQTLVIGATNFAGSPLEAMLGGMPDLPTAEEPTEEPEEQAAEEEAPAPEPEKPAKPAKPAKAPKAPAAPKAAPAAPAKAAPAPKAPAKPAPAQEPKKAPPKAAPPLAQPSAADALAALGL